VKVGLGVNLVDVVKQSEVDLGDPDQVQVKGFPQQPVEDEGDHAHEDKDLLRYNRNFVVVVVGGREPQHEAVRFLWFGNYIPLTSKRSGRRGGARERPVKSFRFFQGRLSQGRSG
jgi:hypothetical protein